MRAESATVLLSLMLFSGCDDSIFGVPTDPDGDLVYTPDWDGVVALTGDHCAACHVAGGTAENTPLPLALQVDLTEETGRWVVPFDPEGSALWRALSGELAADDFGVMPLGTGPLATSQVDHVRLWILDGAPFPPLEFDGDGDGFASDDCDDADPAVNPGASEACDGIDNDCDGEVDEPGATGGTIYYRDGDGDGWGVDTDTVDACSQPAGYTELVGDCNDGDSGYNPGISETDCGDPNDYNCDGSVGTDDNDGDGFQACQECNDADPNAFPGADEYCNGRDDDCNGTVDDDAVDADRWWQDVDGDSWGDPNGPNLLHCTGTGGWVTNDGDCNDGDAAISPDAPLDPADMVDNDCDGDIDEDAGAGVSHAVSIQPIWNANCLTRCHSGFLPSDGMSLSTNGWDDLVNVPSNDVSGMDRVAPGDPQNSYLWHKLNNTHQSVGGVGSAMPKQGQSLSGSELALVEQWILDGALP